MNFKPIILILGLLCFIKHQSLAQVYGYEAFSSCGSFCNSNNYFAALNNPSEMLNSNTTLSYSISNPYGVRELYSSGLNLQTSTKQIAMGMTWQNQGNAGYQQNTIGLCTALKPIKEIKTGLRGKIEYLNLYKYGKRKFANIDASISVQVHSKIKSSFIVQNIFNLPSSQFEGSTQNQIVQWGIGYSIEKRIQLIFEFEKSSLSSIKFKSAISFRKDSSFNLNICSSNAGKQLGLGIGLKKQKTELGFAFTAHILLGFSTCISIAYEIKS